MSPSTPQRSPARSGATPLTSSDGLERGLLSRAEKRFALRLASVVYACLKEDGIAVEVTGSAAVLHRSAGQCAERPVGDVDCFVYLGPAQCQGAGFPWLDSALLSECRQAQASGEVVAASVHLDGSDASAPGRVVAVGGKRVLEIVFVPLGHRACRSTSTVETVDGVCGVPVATTTALLHQYQHNVDGRSYDDGWKLAALAAARGGAVDDGLWTDGARGAPEDTVPDGAPRYAAVARSLF